MDGPALKPRVWRIVAYFVAIFVAVAAPTVVPWMFILFGAQPYQLDRSAMTDAWQGASQRDGVAVDVREYPSDKEARRAASEAFERIETDRMTRGTGTFRYRRADTKAHGLILRVENLVVQAEGKDAASVEQAVGGLPFLRSNPRSADRWLSNLFEEHLAAVLAGIGVYLVLVTIAMFRGGAWAARISPPEGVPPLPAEEMRRRLLAVNELDVPVRVREGKRGRLVAEWRLADAKWTSVLERGGLSISHRVKFELNGARHVVRAIDFSKKVSWSAGVPQAGFSFSFFRGITFSEFESGASYGLFFKDGAWKVDPAYRYSYDLSELKQPLVEAVVAGGWTYQPVAFFLPLLG